MSADVVMIVLLIVAGAVGYLLGFGKGFKFITGGVVGVILSIILCLLFGKGIRSIPQIATLINDNILWILVYYVVLFGVMQLLRLIAVTIIKKIMEADNLLMKVTNKVLGTVLMMVVFAILVLLILALVKKYPDLSTSKDIWTWIQNTFVYDIYLNNVIVF